MARHSNGKNSFAVAGWVIAVAIIALLAIVALVVFLLRDAGNDDGEDSAAPAAVEAAPNLHRRPARQLPPVLPRPPRPRALLPRRAPLQRRIPQQLPNPM